MHQFQEYYNLTKDSSFTKSPRHEDLSYDDIQQLEKITKSTVEDFLRDIDDERLFVNACIHLQRIYKLISSKYSRNLDEKIEYLSKAYEVCKNSKNLTKHN